MRERENIVTATCSTGGLWRHCTSPPVGAVVGSAGEWGSPEPPPTAEMLMSVESTSSAKTCTVPFGGEVFEGIRAKLEPEAKLPWAPAEEGDRQCSGRAGVLNRRARSGCSGGGVWVRGGEWCCATALARDGVPCGLSPMALFMCRQWHWRRRNEGVQRGFEKQQLVDVCGTLFREQEFSAPVAPAATCRRPRRCCETPATGAPARPTARPRPGAG